VSADAPPTSWPEIAAWRRAKRAEITAARNAMGPAAHRQASTAIQRQLETSFPDLETKRVGCYWPIRHEFDPLPLARTLIARGGAVSLPVVIGKGQPLEFRDWRPDARMASGVYDIPYPADGAAVVVPEVLLVALLGFDDAGFRLGYGAGYYDLTLASYSARPRTIGVGFELGRLPTIHPQPHDIAMDFVVTEAGRFRRDSDRLAAF
jgi:5-formyltetrahydrofolate cyclo-ligase